MNTEIFKSDIDSVERECNIFCDEQNQATYYCWYNAIKHDNIEVAASWLWNGFRERVFHKIR